MKPYFFTFLSAFFINACAVDNHFSMDQPLNIDTVQSADAISDAQYAIANQQFILLGFDQRGLIVPATKNLNPNSIKPPCSIKVVSGMGDVVKSKQHLVKMKKARAYIKTYNIEILNTTSCQ